ncbi:AraC family transcriptional regulator [Sorangium sp. So ce388]|uniref:AraC family transcriptional regulator n=1 Tax=Sorangium sp. So ce388 TaxID=3133309 RepID=UPI003F5C3E47
MTRARSNPGFDQAPPIHRDPAPARGAGHPAAPPVAISRIHLSTSDPDEMSPALARLCPGVALRPLKGAAFRCELRVATVGPVSFVTTDWALGGRIDAAALQDRYVLGLAGEGSSDVEVDVRSQRLSMAHGKRAILLVPGWPVKIQIQAGGKGRSLTVLRSSLEAHLAMLTGHAPREAILFEPDLDLTGGGGATLQGIVRSLRDELERPAPSPFVRPRFCDVLLTALVTIPRHAGSHLLELAPPRVAPAVVRRAEEYIAMHAGEAITLADVVAAAGAPARSLQAAFRAARGVTPMGFLKIRRLELARHMLLAALPETTVADVAGAMGFHSAGRFSVDYRKHFRESPSETLARRRPTGRRRGGVR